MLFSGKLGNFDIKHEDKFLIDLSCNSIDVPFYESHHVGNTHLITMGDNYQDCNMYTSRFDN